MVPIDSHLEIEAMVSNRDIGFVHAGQEAEIKVDTFNFTRYGLLHGEVLSVSQDAIARDKPQDKSNDKAQGAETNTSEPKGQELSYAARVSLDRTQMQIEDKLVNLVARHGGHRRNQDRMRAESSAICCHRCCDTSRKACANAKWRHTILSSNPCDLIYRDGSGVNGDAIIGAGKPRAP